MAEDPTATIDTHLSFHTPAPELVENCGEWKWPFAKFGYEHGGVLFTELHEEFNSVRCAIQDPYAWHLDVKEIAHLAENREMFLTMLRERQNERFSELRLSWENVKAQLVGTPSLWRKQIEDYRGWFNFVRISRNFSYDSFVGFFGEWIKDTPDGIRTLPDAPNLDTQSPQEQPPNPRNTEAGRGSQTLQAEEEGTRPTTTAIRTEKIKKTRAKIRKGKTPAKTVGHGVVSPNKVVKRKPRGHNAEGAKPEGLRRSARLREQAERGSR
ncbi:hypothetical protein GGS24DRAFT_285030 [Hypoxylon argillaceum]|nr:hypothetical protein GGS24DRAFT_285030 [Hypoxylon argillaceum]KAI1144833.1 hypothetical protein F4825DRAFT_302618 [Nemania diffusa]